MADNAAKSVHVQYFAILRNERGISSEPLRTNAVTARELYGELKLRHKFSLPLELLRVSINNEFKSWDTGLEENDAVVFIPPVAGG